MAKRKVSKKTATKGSGKKTEAKKQETQKESFTAWFARKLSAKALKSHQFEEVKEYFRALKLNIDIEDMGKYDKAFKSY